MIRLVSCRGICIRSRSISTRRVVGWSATRSWCVWRRHGIACLVDQGLRWLHGLHRLWRLESLCCWLRPCSHSLGSSGAPRLCSRTFASGLLDTLLCDFRAVELPWQKLKVAFGTRQLTVSSQYLGIFGVQIVQRRKLPIRRGSHLRVAEVGNFSEYRHLLNEVFQAFRVHRKAVVLF